MKFIQKIKKRYDEQDSLSKAVINLLIAFLFLYISSKVMFYFAPASARGICGFISLFIKVDLADSLPYKALAMTIFCTFIVVGIWYVLKSASKVIEMFDDDDDDLSNYLGK